ILQPVHAVEAPRQHQRVCAVLIEQPDRIVYRGRLEQLERRYHIANYGHKPSLHWWQFRSTAFTGMRVNSSISCHEDAKGVFVPSWQMMPLIIQMLLRAVSQRHALQSSTRNQICAVKVSCVRFPPFSSDVRRISAVTGDRLNRSSPTASAMAFMIAPYAAPTGGSPTPRMPVGVSG